MAPLEIVLASVGLGVDAFSVCLGVGTRWHGPRQKFRLSWHMGLFQFLFAAGGYFASQALARFISQWAGIISFVVLAAIGGKMLYEAINDWSQTGDEETPPPRKDPTRGWTLMALSIATSLDALAVGFAAGLEGKHIFPGGIVIGLVAGLMALTGVNLGKRASLKLGHAAEAAGGVLLIGLGIYMLLA